MKLFGKLGLCAVAAAVALSGCSSSDSPSGEPGGGTITVAMPAQPASLDPDVTIARVTSDIGRTIFETLVTLDSDFTVQPMLADSWEESPDGKTITFTLRQNVKFHDGTTMTADDVVASMNRWIRLSATGQGVFEGATFQKTDDRTVVMTLAAPTGVALPVLAHPGEHLAAIMPKSIIDTATDEPIKEYIGTGPFKFVEWVPDQNITLDKFSDYSARSEPRDGLAGDRTAEADQLIFRFVADPATRMLGLETGEYEVSTELPFDSAERLKSNPDLEVRTQPDGLLTLYYNKKEGPFANVEARRALAQGIDKNAIMQAAVGNPDFYDLVNHMMMKQQEGTWNTDVGMDTFDKVDAEGAKRKLQELGLAGTEVTLITSREYSEMYNGAVALENQLTTLGLKPKLEVYDWPTFSELRDDPMAWDLMMLTNSPKIEPTSMAFFRPDFAGWSKDPKLDELLAQFNGEPTLEDARSMYGPLQEWVYDYVPVTKLGDIKYMEGVRKGVVTPDPLFGGAWWGYSPSA